MNKVKIFAKIVEDSAKEQITEMANSPLGEKAHIRIMPDCHAGAGCVIGTTMYVRDKVCPNLVGVDIGCGVLYAKTNISFEDRLDELDSVIRRFIPYGMNAHKQKVEYDFSKLRCYNKGLNKAERKLANKSLGTLGGGNHFIEAYEDGGIAIHSGSRNIGLSVAEYYQNLAIEKTAIKYGEENKSKKGYSFNKDLCYLTGQDMKDYLNDVEVMQKFADDNRKRILKTIMEKMGGKVLSEVNSIHNYIDVKNKILRKGAISAQKGEVLVIPLNMRDGLLLCEGKGNADWNYSAPHGAGRLYSRHQAKKLFTVEEYRKSMEGIYSTCINRETLDEAPFAYKDYKSIVDCIKPTVTIKKRLIPIYNFKAN